VIWDFGFQFLDFYLFIHKKIFLSLFILYKKKLIRKKTDSICLYLREKYFYCVWCSSTYESDIDMSNNCPGLTEVEHESDE